MQTAKGFKVYKALKTTSKEKVLKWLKYDLNLNLDRKWNSKLDYWFNFDIVAEVKMKEIHCDK